MSSIEQGEDQAIKIVYGLGNDDTKVGFVAVNAILTAEIISAYDEQVSEYSRTFLDEALPERGEHEITIIEGNRAMTDEVMLQNAQSLQTVLRWHGFIGEVLGPCLKIDGPEPIFEQYAQKTASVIVSA